MKSDIVNGVSFEDPHCFKCAALVNARSPLRHSLAFATVVCVVILGACTTPTQYSGNNTPGSLSQIDRQQALKEGVRSDVPIKPTYELVTSYIVQPNDTLGSIALEQLGRVDAWEDIAQLNDIDDPASLIIGQRLQLSSGRVNATNSTGSPRLVSVIDLGDAIHAARRHDSVIEIAARDADIIRAGVPAARSALLPQANLQASIGRFAAGSERDLDYTESEAALLVSQTLFDRNRGRELLRARLQADAANLRLLDAHETLVLRTARVYFAVLNAQSEVTFRRSDLRAIGEQLTQARQRFNVGASPSTNRDEALAQRDIAAVALLSAENALSNALEALDSLTGLDQRTLALAAPALTGIQELPQPTAAQGWVALAERYNASLREVSAEQEAAKASLSAARSLRLPSFALEGALANLESNNQISIRPDGGSGSLSLVARVPLLTGGLIGAQIQQANSALQLSNATRQNVYRDVVSSTRTAFRNMTVSARQATALEQALDSSRQAARATRAGFEAGTRTSVEVLASERNTLRAEADLARAHNAYLVNRLELQRISGTLAESDVEQIDVLLSAR